MRQMERTNKISNKTREMKPANT